jgi:murein L,D-transpeptidase YcbB/YkuD
MDLRKLTPKLIAVGVVVILIISLIAFNRKTIFSNTKEKIDAILHRKENKVMVETDSQTISNKDLLRKYFEQFGYDAIWSDNTKKEARYRTMLIEMLQHADSLGLNPNDYHADYLAKYDSMVKTGKIDIQQLAGENEVIFTDAAISFLHDVAYGRNIPAIEYNGIEFNIDSTRILSVYKDLLEHKDWERSLASLEPKIPQYIYLKKVLNDMKSFNRANPKVDSVVISDNSNNADLLLKLKLYGLANNELIADSFTADNKKIAIKAFQRMMNVDTTGALDKKTVTYLNLPAQKRMAQLEDCLNHWRWTGRLKENEFVLVNIPAARLQIVNRDSVKDMGMRVIVGKPTTRTPSFTAYISKVIAYPYWTVPISIATKEILPKLKKNAVQYLEDQNMQVLDRNGKEVDPATVNWSALSEKKFPYKLRQSTGCDNALGIIKFELNSPFSIYLHDTNRRDLFGRKDRFMSHGCVRVEKPMELANYLLQNTMDSLTVAKLNQCLKEEKPSDFKLGRKVPVLIFYMTADVDENGQLKFYNDVYDLEVKEGV